MKFSYLNALLASSRLVSTGPAPTDPNYASVVLLLHLNGSNGSSTIVDNGPSARTPDSVSITISTADSKFGGASGQYNGGRIIYPSTMFNPGSGNFTVEGWAKFTGGSNDRAFLFASAASNGGDSRCTIYRTDTGTITGILFVGGTSYTVVGSSTTPTGWFHFAFVRNGTAIKLYINGTTSNSTDVTSGSVATPTSKWAIGAAGEYTGGGSGGSSGDRWVGFMDEFRITTVARYTANFTVPDAAFPNSA